MRALLVLGLTVALVGGACVSRARPTPVPALTPPPASPSAGAPSAPPGPGSSPSPASSAPTATPLPPVGAGMTRFDIPNLGLTIDLPESWVDVFDLSLADYAELQERDPVLAGHATSWISVRVRLAEGGDTGLIAVDRSTGSVLRILYAAPAAAGDDLREVAEAVLSVDGYESEDIESTTETVVLGQPGLRYDLSVPNDDQHRLLVDIFRAPNGEWGRVDLAVPTGIADAAPFLASAVTTLHATGREPAGAFHAMTPDPRLQDMLPAELDGLPLTVFTGPRIDLEYAGIYDDFRRAFGPDWEALPAVAGRVDEARMGVAFGSRADERIEIFALRVPGLTTEDWRPLSDDLPAAEWTPIDDERITFRNTAGTNVGGPRGDTLFNIEGSAELLDAAVALLLPAP